jgi:hypothetical protein
MTPRIHVRPIRRAGIDMYEATVLDGGADPTAHVVLARIRRWSEDGARRAAEAWLVKLRGVPS